MPHKICDAVETSQNSIALYKKVKSAFDECKENTSHLYRTDVLYRAADDFKQKIFRNYGLMKMASISPASIISILPQEIILLITVGSPVIFPSLNGLNLKQVKNYSRSLGGIDDSWLDLDF